MLGEDVRAYGGRKGDSGHVGNHRIHDFPENHSHAAVKEWVGSVCLISMFNNIKPLPEARGGICPRTGVAAAGTVMVQRLCQRLREPWGVG